VRGEDWELLQASVNRATRPQLGGANEWSAPNASSFQRLNNPYDPKGYFLHGSRLLLRLM